MIKKVLILLIYLSTTLAVKAAKIDKAYEALRIYDYFKAKKLFYITVKKEPLLASYGLATIYLRSDNPFHNFDSSYKYIEISYTSLIPKQINKLKKFGLTDSSIYKLRDSIHELAFQYYLKKAITVISLEEFMNNQPNSKFYNIAMYKRDSLVYIKMKSEKNSMSMENFLRCYPQSVFIQQALRDIDYFRYAEFSANKSFKQIEKFIDSFPRSNFIIQAQDKLLELAIENKNPEYIHRYIKRFPDNSHIENSWKSLYSIEVGSYSTSALNAFLEKYPDFPYRQTIEKELSLANTRLILVVQNGLYGFIDTSGQYVIPAVYNGLEEFSDGLALAEKDGKFGYINKTGEVVVPFLYDDGEAFRNGRAIVKLGQDYFLVDRSGNRVTESYSQISDFSEGLAVVKFNGLYGAIDKNGKIEISPQYTRLGDFSEGFSFAQKNEKSGYVDRNGDPVIPFMFEWAESFKRSLARVKYNNKFGLINSKGEFVLQPVYDRIEEQEQGVYVVYKNGFYGFADSIGCLLSEVKYVNPSNEKPNQLTDGKWLRLLTEDDQNLMDKNGKHLAAEEEYEELYLPKYNLIRCYSNEKYGFVNSKNKVIIKPLFDEAEDFEDSVCVVKKKDTWMIIDVNGAPLSSIKAGNLEKVSKSYYLYQSDKGTQVICDKRGVVYFGGDKMDVEILFDRYLISSVKESNSVFDLKEKKFILKN